jgi:hypothetical protein
LPQIQQNFMPHALHVILLQPATHRELPTADQVGLGYGRLAWLGSDD